MEHDFKYISKKNANVQKAYSNSVNMLKEVQDLVRDKFTFRFDIIGSYKLNMITYDAKSNIGYDFDFNIEVNDDNCDYTPKEIKKQILLPAFQKVCKKYGYGNPEDSTRVITIKKINHKKSRIQYSCDLAIVNNYTEDDGTPSQEYIHFDKKQNRYLWQQQSNGLLSFNEKLNWIKRNNLYELFKEFYLINKNFNNNPHNHSRQIRISTATEICQKYGYFSN